MDVHVVDRSDGAPVSLCPRRATHDRSEKELIEAAKAGCHSAFEDLVQKYEARVFRLAQRITHCREDAEEAMQNAFLQVVKNLSRFRGDSGFYTWLARITINEALMKLRQRRFIEVSIDNSAETDDGSVLRDIEDWGPTPEQRYSQTELRSILAATIARLSIGYRTVFQLRDVEGFSTEETAELLGLTASAVKTRLRRARNQLRWLLNDYLKPPRCKRPTSAAGWTTLLMIDSLPIKALPCPLVQPNRF